MTLFRCCLIAACLLTRDVLAGDSTASYEVRGVVKELRLKAREIVIKHEEIPGYREGMTMAFALREKADLSGLQPGDSVTFTLRVTPESDLIETIKLIQRGAAVTRDAPKDAGTQAIKEGEIMPVKGIKLVNAQGQSFDLGELSPRALVITFIFTRCPIPEMCPLLSSKFAQLQTRLAALDAEPPPLLLSVTIDPQYDTPKVLTQYAALHQANSRFWWFATGELKEVSHLAQLCGMSFWYDQGFLNHGMKTIVMDSSLRVKKIYDGNKWSADNLMSDIKGVISNDVDEKGDFGRN